MLKWVKWRLSQFVKIVSLSWLRQALVSDLTNRHKMLWGPVENGDRGMRGIQVSDYVGFRIFPPGLGRG